jgi:cathepsin F
MKAVLVLALVASAFALSPILNPVRSLQDQKDLFAEFKSTFGIKYNSTEEHDYRFTVFQSNLQSADKLNREQSSATFGVTKFSDMTKKEFADFYLPDLLPHVGKSKQDKGILAGGWDSNCKRGDSVQGINWVGLGYVTPVNNQEQCGDCYAFSACASLESQIAIANQITNPGSNYWLSPQQITDCDNTDNHCNGGLYTSAWQYIGSAGGIEGQDAYPFTGAQGSCAFNGASQAAGILSGGSQNDKYFGVTDPWPTTSDLVNDLLNNGPVSVAIDATPLQSYTGGIISPSSGCTDSIDHAVTVVGVDSDSTSNFFVVKNSWGTGWGVNPINPYPADGSGYFLMYECSCAINGYWAQPVGATSGPTWGQ